MSTRDVAAIAVAVAASGMAFGVLAAGAGLSSATVLAMGLLVAAGGSQFAFVGVLAAGGSPIAAAVSGLLLNARMLPLGIACAPAMGRSLGGRLLGAHLVTDEAAAVVTAAPDGEAARRGFWRLGLTMLVVWQVTSLVGAALGVGIADPTAFGLDVAFPATFVALLAPLLRRRAGRVAAVRGITAAVVAAPVLPIGLPVLLAAAAGTLRAGGWR